MVRINAPFKLKPFYYLFLTKFLTQPFKDSMISLEFPSLANKSGNIEPTWSRYLNLIL